MEVRWRRKNRLCVTHANWVTLRFPDINCDGRGDYVYIGEGGALKYYMNNGTSGGQDVLFHDQGGIFDGGTSNITKIVFADVSSHTNPLKSFSYDSCL